MKTTASTAPATLRQRALILLAVVLSPGPGMIILSLALLMWSATPDASGRHQGAVVHDVRDFGARGDGVTLDTEALQRAIDSCAGSGGMVLLREGTYLSGTLVLRSTMTLHIAAGAVLLGSPRIDDYPPMRSPEPSYTNTIVTQSLLFGDSLTDVALEGMGTIDGQGARFPVRVRTKPERYKDRPHVLRLIRSTNVRVENLTMRNSAMWMQHYLACERVVLRGLRIDNHSNMNNDMIDIDGCRDVVVSDIIGDSDDDGICLKSTSGRLCENVAITNCILSSHCNALKIGTESHGGFRNIAISNIVIRPSRVAAVIFGQRRGLGGITLTMVDGGIVEGIQISNVRIDSVHTPLFLRLGDRGRVFAEGMPRPPVGRFRNVRISHVHAIGADTLGCSITGLPGHPIEDVGLSDVSIRFAGGVLAAPAIVAVPERPEYYPESTMFGTLPAFGLYVRHAAGIVLSGIALHADLSDRRPALVCDDVRGFTVGDLEVSGGSPRTVPLVLRDVTDARIRDVHGVGRVPAVVRVEGTESDRISLRGIAATPPAPPLLLDEETRKGAVSVEGRVP